MKKRILAFALTLAMVVTSLSMLSFVSFADDAVAQSETAKDFYAYRGTLNVDSKLGLDELWVPVNKEIAPGVAVGMSWDYENVYIAVYNEPATNGVAGARADYIDSFTFNIGGAVVGGNLTENTTDAPAGASVKLGYAGEDNFRCVIEASVPLSQITLDEAKLAAGVLSVPTTLTINQVYADETTPTTTADLNVILSGRSLAYQTDRINPTGAAANNTSLFGSAHVYNRTAGASMADTDDFKATSTFSGGQGNVNAHLVVVDKMIADGKIEFMRNTVNLHELIGSSIGGQNYSEFQFTINNLPVNGEMTAVDAAATYTNKPSYILVEVVGIGPLQTGARVNLYNAGGTDGLSVVYTTASGIKSVSLGVEEGEQFWFGINEVSTDKIELYVNDVCIADDMIGVGIGATSDRGYVWVASQRGKSGVGTNGYSLDLNQDGVVDDEECISFSMGDTALSSVAPVDVATVASLTKTGGVASTSTLVAKYGSDANTVNVGSLATASAKYDKSSLEVTVSTANLDTIAVNVGGFEATATMCIANSTTRPHTMGATLDAVSTAAGVTVTPIGVAAQTITFKIPLEKIIIEKDATGNAVADIQIYVEKSDQGPDSANGPRVHCVTDGVFNGTLAFDIEIPEQTVVSAKLNWGTDKSWKQTAGTAHGTGGYHNFMMTDSAAYMNTETERITKFTLTVNTMEEVDINNVSWGTTWSANMEQSQRIVFAYFSDYTSKPGAIMFQIYNTSNGIYLVYKNYDGTLTKVALGAELGDALDFELVYGFPTYGYIKVNGNKVIEKEDIRSQDNEGITTNGGLYAMGYVGTKSPYQAYDVSITNKTIETKTPYVAPDFDVDDLVALGASTTPVVSSGSIKLSYVQESTVATRTGSALTHNTAFMQGGSQANTNGKLIVQNTADTDRALAQGGFAPLGLYGNRTINFALNVQNLNAYDFATQGGTLEGDAVLSGDAKYADLSKAYGRNMGIGDDCNNVQAFDKLLIGAVANASADSNTFAAMAFYVVNDTTDGLVLIHTNYEGEETVMIIGNGKMAQNINVTIVWNRDNTGSVKIDDADAVVFDDCRTVISDFSKGPADTVTQCYFAGVGPSNNGYFGINSTKGAAKANEGYVVPHASIESFDATVVSLLDVRFIATIDTIKAKEAGFEINLKGSDKVITKSTTTAYNAISANNGREVVCATEGNYFIALDVQDVPTTGTYTFVVKPFFTYAGETTYGTAYEVTYTNGVYSGYAVAN